METSSLNIGINWTVHKFGGLSVGEYLTQIPLVVEHHLNYGSGIVVDKVAIICSARSSPPHTVLGTTSRYVNLVFINNNNKKKGSLKTYCYCYFV